MPVPKEILYLTEADVKKTITYAEAVDLAEKGVKADAAGNVNGNKFYMNVGEDGFIKPFSGYIYGEDFAFVKTFSYFPVNPEKKLPGDLEDCIEKVKVKLPAVISVTGEINEPRLPTLLQIRRAYARPIAKYKLSDFGIESVEPGVKYIDIEPVAIKRKNIIFKGDKLEDIADKLIEKLIEEGVLKGVKL